MKILALCRDYNGNKDVLFMMESSDFRLDGDNWVKFADGKYAKGIFTATNGNRYRVYGDWSVQSI
jgi:hypothetical protein